MDITSRDNAKVKLLRSLRQSKGRQATGLFLIEGIRHVGEAVEAAGQRENAPQIEMIVYSPELLTSSFARQLIQEQEEKGTPVFSLPADIFATIAEKENPQGIVAAAHRPSHTLETLDPLHYPWLVALASPQDPGNIGSILRTIDAVGASGLLLLGESADPYQPSAVRASMGTIFWYPVIQASFNSFVKWGKRNGYTIYGTSAKGSVDYLSIQKYNQPLVLLMGSEREGLSPEQVTVCDHLLRLPMMGRVTSLNLATATGVMLYRMLAAMGS